jgi:dTDP-4-amino-4,6-dideoxygalactose transaminase
MPSLLALNVPIIEDISESVGAVIGEKKAGQYGTFAIMGLEERDLLTGGGGAILVAPAKRESIVLKKLSAEAPATDVLPDLNSALAYVQLKELGRNGELRREIHSLYVRSLMQGRHKTFNQSNDGTPSYYCFPVVLSSGLKEVRQYVNRKEIEIEPAFANSVAGSLGDELEGCINAKSLLMRCILFPLYPRLGTANAAKIAKVLATLP